MNKVLHKNSTNNTLQLPLVDTVFAHVPKIRDSLTTLFTIAHLGA